MVPKVRSPSQENIKNEKEIKFKVFKTELNNSMVENNRDTQGQQNSIWSSLQVA